jgi:isopenicillin-N N-acyltransferase-like protein
VLAVLPRGDADQPVLLCQNWDWYTRSRDSLVTWRVESGGSGWFVTVTEAGILAKIGLNSHTLGCCLNHLSTTQDGGVEGTPVHVLLRLVLQRCSTVREAASMLESESLSASSCITLAQALPEPAAVGVELSPGGAERIAPDEHGCVMHTNHFIVAPPQGADTARESPGSRERLDELTQWSRGLQGAVTLESLQPVFQSHLCAPTGICRHVDHSLAPVDQSETLTSVLMDLSRRELLLTDGMPCSTPYRAPGRDTRL